jgi:mannan endo-1,4-beta-mannosidase
MFESLRLLALVLATCLGAAACGPGVTTGAAGQGIAIDVQPTAPTVRPGGRVNFTATVTGTVNTSVTWALSEGSGCGTATCHVVATSAADPAKSAVANVSVSSTTTGGTPRPPYNTGTGFFVLNGRLYDANGFEFKIKGVNKNHYDSEWRPGLVNANPNTIRVFTPIWDLSATNTMLSNIVGQKIVAMPVVAATEGTWSSQYAVTCDGGTMTNFNKAVDLWVAAAATIKPYESKMLLNVANEWGDAATNNSYWRDGNITAIKRLRGINATGNANPPWLGTIIIDAAGCGQDPYNFLNSTFAQEVFNADPQKNIVFSVHVYGFYCEPSLGIPCGVAPDWSTLPLAATLDSLQATGFPFIIGEFGPGRRIGPSPTLLNPGTIIQDADARNFGWVAWAWDDRAGGTWPMCDTDTWFNMVYRCGDGAGYATSLSSDLTLFGRDVVENPTYGLRARATKATVFP